MQTARWGSAAALHRLLSCGDAPDYARARCHGASCTDTAAASKRKEEARGAKGHRGLLDGLKAAMVAQAATRLQRMWQRTATCVQGQYLVGPSCSWEHLQIEQSVVAVLRCNIVLQRHNDPHSQPFASWWPRKLQLWQISRCLAQLACSRCRNEVSLHGRSALPVQEVGGPGCSGCCWSAAHAPADTHPSIAQAANGLAVICM